MSTGSELIRTMSSALYKNAYIVFDELISNAYDADASKVIIEFRRGSLIVKDNGVGMDDEGLTNYLFLGRSTKDSETKTRRFGRNTIGKFGIGKLSMNVVCHACTLESVCSGIKRRIDLDFDKIMSYEKLEDAPIIVTEEKSLDSNGTSILLTGLKIALDPVLARRRILKTMPLNPNFKVILNGIELSPASFINGKVAEFSLADPVAGTISGKITYSDTPLGDSAGIYVRVFGRVVNADNPKLFDLLNSLTQAGSFISRIYCVVDADGLEDIVLAHRNGFKEDSPKFNSLKKVILSELRKFTTTIQAEKTSGVIDWVNQEFHSAAVDLSKLEHASPLTKIIKKYEKNRPDKTNLVRQIKAARKKINEEVVHNSKSIDRQIAPLFQKIDKTPSKLYSVAIGDQAYQFKIVALNPEDKECIIDTTEKSIYINSNHPQFNLSLKEGSLRQHFRRILAFEISLSLSNNSLSTFCRNYEEQMRRQVIFKQEAELFRA